MTRDNDDLARLAQRLATRREAVMACWRSKVRADPLLRSGSALPEAQLNDHISALLEDFERRLSSLQCSAPDTAEQAQGGDAAAHALHRWQQGFDLAELMLELGRLNECVVAEIGCCATALALSGPAVVIDVNAAWAGLYSVALSGSASHFFRLQQLEAVSHVADLEQALAASHALETQQAALWQQAAHDLRGDLNVVSLATAGLSIATNAPDSSGIFLDSLQRNLRSLHAMLEDVTSLARLQGGQEQRTLARVDIARHLRELIGAKQALAHDRGLCLRFEGPDQFSALTDATKIGRIAQNLVLNALRYTPSGGVTVRCGADERPDADRWFLEVADTGPGLRPGPGSALAAALGLATEQARDVDQADAQGTVTHVSRSEVSLAPAPGPRRAAVAPGEGIGLSIVKRLCTLLDATVEMQSRPDKGTSFKILFPSRYDT